MAQNSQRMSWTAEEVDGKLKLIMEECFRNGLETAKVYVTPKEGEFPSLVAGSNIAGFSKVAEGTCLLSCLVSSPLNRWRAC